MPYEVYQRSDFRVEQPTLSLVPGGRIALNAPATRAMALAGVKSVLLLWDSRNRKIAIKAAPSGDKNAYALAYSGDKRSSSLIRAKSFLRFVGWNSGKRQRLPATWDPKSRMLEATLPDGSLQS